MTELHNNTEVLTDPLEATAARAGDQATDRAENTQFASGVKAHDAVQAIPSTSGRYTCCPVHTQPPDLHQAKSCYTAHSLHLPCLSEPLLSTRLGPCALTLPSSTLCLKTAAIDLLVFVS